MGYRRFGNQKLIILKRKFHYVKELEAFACPMGCKLSYVTTDREGYRHYKSNKNDCAVCPLREKCMSSNKKQSEITHHIWEPY